MAITQKPETPVTPAPQPVLNKYAGYAKKAELDDALETAMEQKTARLKKEENDRIAQSYARKEAQEQATADLIARDKARAEIAKPLYAAEVERRQALESSPEADRVAMLKNALALEQEKEEQNPDSIGSQPRVGKTYTSTGGKEAPREEIIPMDRSKGYAQIYNKRINFFDAKGAPRSQSAIDREAWEEWNKNNPERAVPLPENVPGRAVDPFPWNQKRVIPGKAGTEVTMYEPAGLPEFKPAEKKADAGFNFGDMLKGIGGALGPLAGLVQAYSYGQSGNTTAPLAIDTLAKRRAENEAREKEFEQQAKLAQDAWTQKQAELALQLQNNKELEMMRQAGNEKLANIGGWYDLEKFNRAQGPKKPVTPYDMNIDRDLRSD